MTHIIIIMITNRLGLPNLDIEEKYEKIFFHFGRDVEATQKLYQKHKADPPVGRDLPPIAGKIAWVRQLYRRIQDPMTVFKTFPRILQSQEAKRVIKNYNKVAKVLLEYEMIYYHGWNKQVSNTV